MYRVALGSFFSGGLFGSVSLGDSRATPEAKLGPPDDTGGTSSKRTRPAILRYGDVEFHFAWDRLSLIYFDRFSGQNSAPSGGSRLELDPWFVAQAVPLRVAEKPLREAGFAYRIVSQPDLDRTLVVLASGVELAFADAIADAGLSFVSLQVAS